MTCARQWTIVGVPAKFSKHAAINHQGPTEQPSSDYGDRQTGGAYSRLGRTMAMAVFTLSQRDIIFTGGGGGGMGSPSLTGTGSKMLDLLSAWRRRKKYRTPSKQWKFLKTPNQPTTINSTSQVSSKSELLRNRFLSKCQNNFVTQTKNNDKKIWNFIMGNFKKQVSN